jgi:hypothetical protein
MAHTTGTPETIQGKTARHTNAIHDARMTGLGVIAANPHNPLLGAWNELNAHVTELLELQRCQIALLEALCRNQQAKAEARS